MSWIQRVHKCDGLRRNWWSVCVWLGPVTTPDREPSVGESVSLFREPDAGNPPVRFDERKQETELRQAGLRRVVRKHPNSHREAKATAPVLDSTLHTNPDQLRKQEQTFRDKTRVDVLICRFWQLDHIFEPSHRRKSVRGWGVFIPGKQA